MENLPSEILHQVLRLVGIDDLLLNCRWVSLKWAQIIRSVFFLTTKLSQRFEHDRVHSACTGSQTIDVGQILSEILPLTFRFTATDFALFNQSVIAYRRLAPIGFTNGVQFPALTTRNHIFRSDGVTWSAICDERPYVIHCFQHPRVEDFPMRRQFDNIMNINFKTIFTPAQLELIKVLRPWIKLSFKDYFRPQLCELSRDFEAFHPNVSLGISITDAHHDYLPDLAIFIDSDEKCVFVEIESLEMVHLEIYGFFLNSDMGVKLSIVSPYTNAEREQALQEVHIISDLNVFGQAMFYGPFDLIRE